ncbi:MAG: tyrosine-type recombinase/integrase [Selenomonadaceae bacterium]|nr:tyrosine-type recombinase/integrase [Selenomonadaceae bacterium]
MATVSTRKRGSKWYYSFDAGLTAKGTRKRIEKGSFDSKKEAHEAGLKAYARYLNGDISLTSDKITLRDFLEQWLEMKSGSVRPTTLQSYRVELKRVSDILGDKILQKLHPLDIDSTVKELAKQGYAKQTLSMMLTTLKTALAYAVYPGQLIRDNPAQYINTPKRADMPEKKVERHLIRQEQLDELLAKYPFGNPYHMPMVIAYHTGMRLGEVIGLAWDAVNLDEATISVIRQVVPTRRRGLVFSVPKTKTSIRTIPIDDELVEILRRWQERQTENEQTYGESYSYCYEDATSRIWQFPKNQPVTEEMTLRQMVCTNKCGRVVRRDTVMRCLRLNGLNSHSFRHTHATLCAENGAPAKGLADRLGHSNTNLTENLYTHTTDKMQKETLSAFSRATKRKK